MKKIFIVVILLACCICFAGEFNQGLLKNPPQNIVVNCFDDGDVLFYPKASAEAIYSDLNLTISIGPRILKVASKNITQIVFFCNAEYPAKIIFKYPSTTYTFELPLKNARRNTFFVKGQKFYRLVLDLNTSSYIKNFIHKVPNYYQVKLPSLDRNTLEFPIIKEWQDAFDAMKPFFKLDNAVQVQFR